MHGYCAHCQSIAACYDRSGMAERYLKGIAKKVLYPVSTDWGTHDLCIECSNCCIVSTSLMARFIDWFFPVKLPWIF